MSISYYILRGGPLDGKIVGLSDNMGDNIIFPVHEPLSFETIWTAKRKPFTEHAIKKAMYRKDKENKAFLQFVRTQ